MKGLRGLIVPRDSAPEAAVVEKVEAIPVASLAEAVGYLSGELPVEPAPSRMNDLFREFARYEDDFGYTHRITYRIDLARLVAQWVGMGCLMGAAVLSVGRWKTPSHRG